MIVDDYETLSEPVRLVSSTCSSWSEQHRAVEVARKGRIRVFPVVTGQPPPVALSEEAERYADYWFP